MLSLFFFFSSVQRTIPWITEVFEERQSSRFHLCLKREGRKGRERERERKEREEREWKRRERGKRERERGNRKKKKEIEKK